uniref:C2H2-type domain-containing protein n=2 Tax=Loa loa TaxID=7209 RepID=A0A1I7VFI5_LOALO
MLFVNTKKHISFSVKQKHDCRYCNATTLTHKEYLKHLEMHKEHGLYKCALSTCGKKYRTAMALRQHYEKHQPQLLCEICGSFFSYKRTLRKHKKRCHGVRDPGEGNPQLEHILADTRKHHTAGQSSASQLDRSNDEYPSEKFNILNYPDDNIFNYLSIPDDVVVNIEDINIDNSNGNIFEC